MWWCFSFSVLMLTPPSFSPLPQFPLRPEGPENGDRMIRSRHCCLPPHFFPLATVFIIRSDNSHNALLATGTLLCSPHLSCDLHWLVFMLTDVALASRSRLSVLLWYVTCRPLQQCWHCGFAHGVGELLTLPKNESRMYRRAYFSKIWFYSAPFS